MFLFLIYIMYAIKNSSVGHVFKFYPVTVWNDLKHKQFLVVNFLSVLIWRVGKL